ncbi:tRNA pseudouridine(55) synthase TruB [Faecalicatena acetigenes]|uniref:tRNA pseudouridine synthase B n=1 Tax=Faecalicatena acetigenes TaxID=2981790 RepID=A0ABT2TD69_9FIRM|nr:MULTISPECIES: tRNA pseudouridine(55) synthase TruB [Lachnospiraceae]MCU6748192.1 tRNA pseudouridine(55) synthase TruB [Faecalicatena acetigenes]SCI30446.1 tRNA pseudouridine synthase B [uncultured Clostridium sp.]
MINGILNVYKEKGYTSHDVVAKLRGITKQKKIGHTGTLDPDAQGVLPVCLGRATKLCSLLTEKDKIYECTLLLGKETDTQDISGTILEEKETEHLTEETVKKCIQGYIGAYEQIPPMYSALKVNGKKLYELAREGKEVTRMPRQVQIYQIDILAMDLPRVRMRIHCSKGTYIRTLCHDIGVQLGTGGCMEELLRTKVSCFAAEDSRRLEEIEMYMKKGELDKILIPTDRMFSDLRRITVGKKEARLAYNGNTFPAQKQADDMCCHADEEVRVYDEQQQFIGIFYYDEKKKSFKVRKMFLSQ